VDKWDAAQISQHLQSGSAERDKERKVNSVISDHDELKIPAGHVPSCKQSQTPA
jgi:hypothetical protein